MSTFEVRPIEEPAWPEAMRLFSRAFVDYEYVRALYGDDPLERIAGLMREIEAGGWDPSALAVGAWAGDVLVAMAFAEPPGGCRLCTDPVAPLPSDADPLAASMGAFDEMRRQAHVDAPPHAHLKQVAVEPLAQGSGLGRAVMGATLDAIRTCGGGPVLVECVREIEGFYGTFGFTTIGRFDDPAVDEYVLLMRADV
jgi:ribosomal protein S18 acetylase RimI-like enzyme